MRCGSKILFLLLPLVILGMFTPQAVLAQDLTSTPDTLTPVAPGGFLQPQNDAFLRGSVVFSGTAIAAWVLEFSYADNSADTWFPLAQSKTPVSNGTLATWDTSNVTDGLYIVRLTIDTEPKQEYILKIHVSNDTIIETNTPTLTLTATSTVTVSPTSSSMPVQTITATPTSTFTSLDTGTDAEVATMTQTPLSVERPVPGKNPASLNPSDILITLGKGSLASVFLFLMAGLFYFLRHK